MTATVKVNTRDGRSRQATALKPRGSLGNPMTDADIEAKVRELSVFGGASCSIDAISRAAWSLDETPDVRAFIGLLASEGLTRGH
jgi:2-methylcitrate dehydratase PrpD